MDNEKVDQILQLTLVLASQEDDYQSRSLGPIHLIKYVYLADLAFAKRRGITFTGIDWQFYKFGPWSNELFGRIDPALNAIGAEKRSLPSAFSEDDYTRWAIKHSPSLETIERGIPAVITSELSKLVHEFTSDTPALLHHVYLTKPMLTAAPGEVLDFSQLQAVPLPVILEPPTDVTPLGNKALKRRKEQLQDLKVRVKEKLAGSLQRKVAAKIFTAPRYDDVFEQGQEWLDSLAGEPIKDNKGEVKFSPEIWKSKCRYDPDLS